MSSTAEVLVDHLAIIVSQRLPPGVTPAYFDGYLDRNRAALVAIVDRQLVMRTAADHWSVSQRTGWGDIVPRSHGRPS